MAIGFGAIVAFSPTKLAISILYLSGRVAPVARALAFLIGNTIVIGSVAVLTYLGGVVILGTTTGIPPTASDWLDVVLGIILLAIAAYGLARPARSVRLRSGSATATCDRGSDAPSSSAPATASSPSVGSSWSPPAARGSPARRSA